MIENEQWAPINSPNLNAIEISCLGSDIRGYFETFVVRSPVQSQWNNLGQLLSAGPINKAVPRFRNGLTVREGCWKTFKACFSTQNVFTLTVFAMSRIVEIIFDNVATARLQVAMTKSSTIILSLKSVDNVMKLSRFANK